MEFLFPRMGKGKRIFLAIENIGLIDPRHPIPQCRHGNFGRITPIPPSRWKIAYSVKTSLSFGEAF